MLRLKDVKKSFYDGNIQKTVIHIPNLEISKKKSVIIGGYSGSGKTTILNLISGLLIPDDGDIYINDINIAKLNEAERDMFRANNIGYVFQDFKLFYGLSVLNNVMLGASFGRKLNKKELYNKAVDMLGKVGLHNWLHIKAGKLSGGEKQRVAVARSLVNDPKLILADEPTGNLDHENSNNIMELLAHCAKESDATLLVITHDLQYINRFDRYIDIKEINTCCRGGSCIGSSVG